MIGVNFSNTADSHGPNSTEGLNRKALHPHDGFPQLDAAA